MPPQHSINQFEILSELESHNAFFDDIVNMIPAKLYVAGHSDNDAYHSKYRKGQNKESKDAKRAKNKIAKRDKFDPEKVETTLQAKKRIQREQEEQSSDDEGDQVMMDDDDEHDEEDAKNQTKKQTKGDNSSAGNNSNASRIEQLRAKLHAKIAEKRSAAGITEDGATPANTTSPALVSKRAARRAEKRKRQEAAKQRKKSAPSSVQDRTEPQRVVNLGGSKFNEPASKKVAISAADDLATIDYQSIAGLKKLDPKLDNKSLNPKVKKKSLEKLLADAEKKQQRLKELKASSAKEDKEKAQSMEWGEALKVAEWVGVIILMHLFFVYLLNTYHHTNIKYNSGQNLRKTNDPKLLKKALKRKAKKKAASAKAWGARLDQAKETANKKQQIRSHNLESRKVGGAVGANLSSKKIVERDEEGKDGEKVKRRRLGPHSGQGGNRAGFEGKKQGGFINGDSKGGAKGKQ